MLEMDLILIKETVDSSWLQQHKQEQLATFQALSKEEKAAMLTKMTSVGMEDGKKTEKEGKAEVEEGEEAKI